MNTEQLSTWKEIVRQCKSRLFGSINVASNVRSDAVLAADALVELVTPELASLLERLAWHIDSRNATNSSQVTYTARALAAKIREAIGEH